MDKIIIFIPGEQPKAVKNPLKKIFKILLFVLVLGTAGFLVLRARSVPAPQTLRDGLRVKADSALKYCRAKGLNTDFCILVDFSLHSGSNRFFVWNFKGDSVMYKSLCAHGYGQNSTVTTPVFSNVEGSYCSSLGRYRVGVRSWSRWGINVHYKLHGQDPTNSNAFKRIVVLHSFDPVPEYEIHPVHLPLGMSQGCPVISNQTMRDVDALLKSAAKEPLLWIYN